jgi:Spy/CpxP family protein refolding chaperone
MNKKLTSAVLISSLLFIPVAGQAQQNDSSKGIERMSKELGLTAEQRPKVEAIFNNEKKKVEAIFEEEKQKLQVVQEETRSSLKEVLTPEQMEKLDKKMRQQTRKNGPQKK